MKIDRQLLKWAYQKRFKNSFLTKALIFMGDGPFWMIVLFIAALAGEWLNSDPFRQLAVSLMFGLMISNVVFVLCKTCVKRRRPYANPELQQDLQLIIQNRDPGHGSKELESFPSGHVLWTTICASLICFQFGYLAVLLLGWMIPAMMVLRLHLGVHYPSDVLASLVLGGITVAATLLAIPDIMEFNAGLRGHAGYLYGYWAFISAFLIIGFKSWLKRV
ncbi:MAG: phosphatase PAP2 family protein [Desulfosalsimonadaceae bacterium]